MTTETAKIQVMLKKLQLEVAAGTMTHAAANKALGNYAGGLRQSPPTTKKRKMRSPDSVTAAVLGTAIRRAGGTTTPRLLNELDSQYIARLREQLKSINRKEK